MGNPAVTPAVIRRVRKMLGETQAQFSRRLGVDQVTVARWETGKRKCTGLHAIAIQKLDVYSADAPSRASRAAEPGPGVELDEDIDRVTDVWIEGIRTLESVHLRFEVGHPMVLIGENGTGKSSLIEACELLRKSAGHAFLSDLHDSHQVLGMLRAGARRLRLGVRIEGRAAPAQYEFSLVRQGGGLVVDEETLTVHPRHGRKDAAVAHIRRSRAEAVVMDPFRGERMTITSPDPTRLFLATSGSMPAHSIQKRMLTALERIDIQLPFDVTPRWGARELGRLSPMREPDVIKPTHVLSRFGRNLANSFQALKNRSESDWQETLAHLRLGLGDDIESVVIQTDASGGSIGLALKYRVLADPVPSYALSDGTLAFLAFVAMARLNRDRSLIAIDEPESHLHPTLLMRVLQFLESISQRCPVLIATHSDRLLDALDRPAESTVLCELDERRTTRLSRPDPGALAEWLKDYRGIGDVNAEGYGHSIFTRYP